MDSHILASRERCQATAEKIRSARGVLDSDLALADLLAVIGAAWRATPMSVRHAAMAFCDELDRVMDG